MPLNSGQESRVSLWKTFLKWWKQQVTGALSQNMVKIQEQGFRHLEHYLVDKFISFKKLAWS